jgi:hypothetical protein
MEVLLAGALRREKSFEAATKQMASEVKQLNSLVYINSWALNFSLPM